MPVSSVWHGKRWASRRAARRPTRDGDFTLDLDSIYAHGQRYIIAAAPERVEGARDRDNGGNTAANVGGGAVIGSIIGAIAGGGKGAAIGGAAGAATGLALSAHGREIHIPRDSVLTFRLDQPLVIRASAGRAPRDRNNRRDRDDRDRR
jgi:hypothetical protein